MNFARFERLLAQTMGLSAASIGTAAIARAVRSRLRACEMDDIDAYWALVVGAPDQLQELVEAVVVPETWFYRDAEAFAAMAQIVARKPLSAHPARLHRLLSLPCSTGEEPCTMAMALIDAGVPAGRFAIDAIDISTRALAQARRGIYRGNSFRSRDLGFRDRHFQRTEHGFQINAIVQAPIRFAQGNLLAADFMRGGDVYDVIFCRNLLIYFDDPTQSRAIEVLKRLLAPDGTLFIGHSETGLMRNHGLVSAEIPMAFGYRRAVAVPGQADAAPAATPMFAAKATAPQPHPQPLPRPLRQCTLASPRKPSPLDLDALRRMAGRGHLAEAAQGCQAHMRGHGASADGLFLLGVITDATGDLAAAAGYYRQALYLAPDHADALGHLALLLKKQGDDAGARILNDRTRRLAARRGG